MIGCLPTQALAFLAVFAFTQRTQRKRLRLNGNRASLYVFFCNIVPVGLPACLIQRLQSVQNAAARLIYRLRRSQHLTIALISLHWLRIQERITFRVVVLMYRALNGTALSGIAVYPCR